MLDQNSKHIIGFNKKSNPISNLCVFQSEDQDPDLVMAIRTTITYSRPNQSDGIGPCSNDHELFKT